MINIGELNTNLKTFWPLHLFFIGIGIAFFGKGYAAIPLLIVLCWSIKKFIRQPALTKEILLNDQTKWICLFFVIFITMVFVSDLITDGRWTHREGLIVHLVMGLCMLMGIFLSETFNEQKVLCLFSGWMSFWSLLVLFFVELRFHGIYTYKHGIIGASNELYSLLAIMGLFHFAFFVEELGFKKYGPWLSLTFFFWSFASIVRFSTSDLVLPLFIAGILFLLILSKRKHAMFLFFILIMGSSILISCSSEIMDSLKSADLISEHFWSKLLNKRDEIWTVSLRMIAQHPFFGVGSGNYGGVYSSIISMSKDLPDNMLIFDQSHSVWLQQAVAHGVVACCAYIGLFFTIIRLIIHSYRILPRQLLSMAVFSIWLVFLMYGFVEIVLVFEELIPIVWGSLGLLMGAVVFSLKAGEEKNEH